VVLPGGGYGGHADHEGRPVAEWLNGLGITAVVLKYRLAPHSHHPAMLEDAARASRTVRANAESWKVDRSRVGVLGFSAGGHLASTIATHFDAGDPNAKDAIDRLSSRPDRAILIYPVISLVTPFTHIGSKRNLLGTNPPEGLAESLSNELQVTAETPPTFLAHTDQDKAVPPENSLLFALALRKAKVPVELHLFEEGQHGLGLGRPGFAFSEWPQLCAKWLDGQGFLKK
jgi:acetyl esterase/lipase